MGGEEAEMIDSTVLGVRRVFERNGDVGCSQRAEGGREGGIGLVESTRGGGIAR